MHLIGYFGAQTPLAAALGRLLKKNAWHLERHAIHAPARKHFAPLIRSAFLHGTGTAEVGDEILSLCGIPKEADAAFFLNEHYWASPDMPFADGRLYPEAVEKSVFFFTLFQAGRRSLVVSIEDLSRFLPRSRNDALRSRIRETDWADLFELSWRDLVLQLRDALPGCEIIVIEERFSPALLPTLFARLFPGLDYAGLEDAYRFARQALRRRARLALDAMAEEACPETGIGFEALMELVTRKAKPLLPPEGMADLGIDEDLQRLMELRFREDCDGIRAMAANAGTPESAAGFHILAPNPARAGP